MKKLKFFTFLSILFLLLASLFLVLPVGADVGWLTGWVYRKQINVTPVAGAGLNYTIHLTVYWSNGVDSAGKAYLNQHCQEDFGDLRFTDYDGVTLIPFWINSFVSGVSADIWVKTPMNLSSSNATMYAYYGNSAVETISDSVSAFQRVISSGVVLALPMDEGSGSTVYDYSGYGNNGVITGASWVDGKYGKALNFTEFVSSYVTISDSASLHFNFTNAFTVIELVKTNICQNFQRYFSKSTDVEIISLVTFDKPYVVLTDSVGVAHTSGFSPPLAAGNFTLLTVTWDGEFLKIFHNSDLKINSDFGAVTIISDGNIVRLGLTTQSYPFNGIINGVFCLNCVLNNSVISDFYSFYPQVFNSHFGSVYLRSYISPEPSAYPQAESTERYAMKGEILGAAVVGAFILIPGILITLAIIMRRRR